MNLKRNYKYDYKVITITYGCNISFANSQVWQRIFVALITSFKNRDVLIHERIHPGLQIYINLYNKWPSNLEGAGKRSLVCELGKRTTVFIVGGSIAKRVFSSGTGPDTFLGNCTISNIAVSGQTSNVNYLDKCAATINKSQAEKKVVYFDAFGNSLLMDKDEDEVIVSKAAEGNDIKYHYKKILFRKTWGQQVKAFERFASSLEDVVFLMACLPTPRFAVAPCCSAEDHMVNVEKGMDNWVEKVCLMYNESLDVLADLIRWSNGDGASVCIFDPRKRFRHIQDECGGLLGPDGVHPTSDAVVAMRLAASEALVQELGLMTHPDELKAMRGDEITNITQAIADIMQGVTEQQISNNLAQSLIKRLTFVNDELKAKQRQSPDGQPPAVPTLPAGEGSGNRRPRGPRGNRGGRGGHGGRGGSRGGGNGAESNLYKTVKDVLFAPSSHTKFKPGKPRGHGANRGRGWNAGRNSWRKWTRGQ